MKKAKVKPEEPKKPKYTKTMAAKQLGVTTYRINKLIHHGQLPRKPDAEDVAKYQAKNDAALAKYREAVVKAYEAGSSLSYCEEMVKVAVDNFKIWLPGSETVTDFVWRTVYDHLMEEKRNGIK